MSVKRDTNWCVVALILLPIIISGCGGGTVKKQDYIHVPIGAYFYIKDINFPETLPEGQPLELTFSVNLPDDEAWTNVAIKYKDWRSMHMFVRIDVLDEELALYSLLFGGILVPWPGEAWDLSDLNTPPFVDFEWSFPDDFQVSGRYADGEQFESSPILPVGSYEVYAAAGDPPVGSAGDLRGGGYFGTFEVIPTESAE